MSTTTHFTLISLLMIFRCMLKHPTKAKKAFWQGTALGGLALVLIIFLTLAILGNDLTTIKYYPTYTLAKRINIGNFLQRIEAILAGMFFIFMYVKLIIYFYASSVGLAQVLNNGFGNIFLKLHIR